MKVLIIEDETPIREALSDKFNRDGFDVVAAVNGEEGLAKALAEKPDVIVLDILMPVMDGIKFLEKLRMDTWGSEVPVVVVTNVALNDEMLSRVTKLNPAHYFVKSDWKIEDIVAKAKEAISR